MKKVIMMLLGIAFAGAVWAHPSVVIERPVADEIFLADPLSGFCLPLQLGASDADLNNSAGFAVKVTCGANTLYDKPDILCQKGYPTDLEINEGYSSLPVNVTQTGTITVKTPDGRVTTGTFQFIISAAKYAISYDGNGATGTMKNDIFSINTFVTLSANKFSALGYTFAGWTRDGETVIYGDRARDTNFADPGETRKLYAKWNLNTSGVTATSYSDLVAKVNQAGKQAWNLPVTIGFTSGVKLNGATVTLPSDSGFDGFKYKGDAGVGSDLYVKDGVLYGSKILGEVTVDALQLMQLAMGGSIGEFKAESENIVMLLGNDGKAYLNDDDDVDQMIADILAANPRPTTVKLYKEKGFMVSYDGNGAAGEMPKDMFMLGEEVSLSTNAFSAVGYTFAGWTTNGVDEVVYNDGATITELDGTSSTLELTAKWNETGVSIDAFDVLTNTLVAVTNQAASLPVTITLTGEIAVPQDGVITVNASPAITFAGESMLDVSAVVPTFGTPTVVGEGFASTNAPALFDTKGVSKLVYEEGTISLVARGESEDFPWILDATTNVTAWVENSSLVIDNGLTANSYDIDLVAMTNNFAKYNYTPATPLNAKVKVGEGDYKTPTCWVGESDSYETLGAALEAGETKVLPGYEVVYAANGAAGSMTNSYFAAATEATLKANAYSAVGYDFAGWTLGTNTTVIADSATVKDLASVDGSATLTAKWNATGVSIDAFDVLTNTLVAVTNQAASLPVKITLSGEIAVPQDGVITVNASPAITFAGEAMLDVSAIVPTFGTPTVVGEGFSSTNSPALFDTKGVSKLVYEEGTISLVARGESEDFPWILDASTNVTAWVESSNLVINNGLLANSYDIDLVAMTNNFAKYNYTPASPLNAKVKVGEGDYKTPTCWIGESDSYETLGAALEAGETTVLPGYEVVYAANGAAGSMTNSYFAAATEATLKANKFSAVGYDFEGWTLGTNTTVIADSATVKDLASVDGSATLTAQWSLNADGVTEVSFEALTNTIATAGLQKTNLPITIDFTSEVVIPTNAVLSAFPSGTGFSGIRYVPEEEGYSTLSVSNDVLYASTVREEVTVDALVLMQHAMGGSIPELLALTTDEVGATIATNIVMFVGDNHKAYFNDDDNVDQMIADVLAADPRPTTLKLYEVKGAIVTFEAMGGLIEAGVDPLGNAYEGGVETITYLCLPDPGYELPTVARADYKLIGWYDGWTNGVNEVTNKQEIVNYSEHSLYAKWQSTKIHPSETPGEKIIETKAGEDGTIVRPSDISALPAELILPETDTGAAEGTPLTKIDETAYAGLRGITKVAIPIYVKEIGARAFYNEKNLGEITFVQPRDYATLDKVPLTIGDYAFFGSKLESVTIPSTTSTIGTAAFANCSSLTNVTILGELTIAGDYPFRNCGSAEHPVTITLAPRAAADQAFIDSLTNGCNNVVINEKYAGEITATAIRVDQPEVGKLEIDFTYSANDVDINVDTVTAVTAASLGETGVTAKDPMIPLEIRVNGSNSYTAVFTKPSGASGFFRLTVNIEK